MSDNIRVGLIGYGYEQNISRASDCRNAGNDAGGGFKQRCPKSMQTGPPFRWFSEPNIFSTIQILI
jgi:hypothetical protein